ncbi:hypothetical protein SLH49_03235 [Cognatiyoonia sp. IB215446]|uniref:hypothetical protein n=1 Tax=Cognatiyoonia sp. IB215446 TaxID=3097355 RepID=UPI002A138F48|nr:hypothetical protein [Cognatiyoonia sp. IB215446]MDX8346989.1 hypothetical protein [Cognatiyoonia sp. IB215446]
MESLTAGTIPIVVLIIMLSMVIGAVCTMLGSISLTKSHRELGRVERAYNIGSLGNPVLLELLRDANAKYELASGFMGLLYLSLAASMLASITGLDTVLQEPFLESTDPPAWIAPLYGVVGGVTAYLVKLSSTSTFDALDKVLEDHQSNSTNTELTQ